MTEYHKLCHMRGITPLQAPYASNVSLSVIYIRTRMDCVPKNILLSVYYSIFSSHMTYGCQVWGQGDSQMIKRIKNLQNKAIKLIHFKSFDCETICQIYKIKKILKFQDHVHLSNNLFVYNYLNKNLPDAFVDSVNITHSQHNYQTRNTTKHLLNLPQVNTTKYGLNSIYNIQINKRLEWTYIKKSKYTKNTIKLHTKK